MAQNSRAVKPACVNGEKMTKSIKPGKQRKSQMHMAKHLAKKKVVSKIEKTLAQQIGKKRLPVRKGDTVRIMRGEYKKREGKISRVMPEKGKVFIGEINIKKANGTEKPVPFDASNLMITALEGKDKRRIGTGETKKKTKTGGKK